MSVMYFLSVEWRERVGLTSQTGRCAVVFSLTSTCTPFVVFLRTSVTRRRNSFGCGRMAGNCNSAGSYKLAYYRVWVAQKVSDLGWVELDLRCSVILLGQ